MQGEPISLPTDIFGTEKVYTLRSRIAEAWGKDSNYIQILSQHFELEAEESLSAALGKVHCTTPISLTVIVAQCCAVERRVLRELEMSRGSEYCSHPYQAAKRGFSQVLRMLSERRADLNATHGSVYPKSVACHAAEHGHTEVLRVLGELRADLSVTNANTVTPAHFAAGHGHAEMIRLLAEHRADLSAGDAMKDSPAHVAADNGHVEALRLLIEFRADISKANRFGQTPAQVATGRAQGVLAKFLVPSCSRLSFSIC